MPTVTLIQIIRAAQVWLFVGALFGWCILVGLAQGPWNYCWIFAIGCWAVLNSYWSLAAGNAKRGAGNWLVDLALGMRILLYCLPLGAIPLLGQRFMPHLLPVEVLGASLCALGVGFAIWARRVLAKSWSPIISVGNCHVLVRDGPYAIIRSGVLEGAAPSAPGSNGSPHPWR